jgi:DNA-binding GntR family transcriptional regulator
LTNLEAHARRIRTATAPVWRLIGMDLKYHREVLTAVEQGDAELARDALQRDIREFERLLLSNTSEGMLSLLGQDAPPRTGQLGSA